VVHETLNYAGTEDTGRWGPASADSVLRGHVAARSGDALPRSLAETLREYEVDHAASGLAAAWLITRFVGFRLVTFYMREQPLGGASQWTFVPRGGARRQRMACRTKRRGCVPQCIGAGGRPMRSPRPELPRPRRTPQARRRGCHRPAKEAFELGAWCPINRRRPLGTVASTSSSWSLTQCLM
jgi:hypothetical protein